MYSVSNKLLAIGPSYKAGTVRTHKHCQQHYTGDYSIIKYNNGSALLSNAIEVMNFKRKIKFSLDLLLIAKFYRHCS